MFAHINSNVARGTAGTAGWSRTCRGRLSAVVKVQRPVVPHPAAQSALGEPNAGLAQVAASASSSTAASWTSNTGTQGVAGAQTNDARTSTSSSATDSSNTSSSSTTSSLLSSPALLRRLSAAKSTLDLADALSDELYSSQSSTGSGSELGLTEEDARTVMLMCLDSGRTGLAIALYKDMCLAARRRGVPVSRPNGSAGAGGAGPHISWPPATLETTSALVLGLCQHLCIMEALQVLNEIKVQGLPKSEEVGFGQVITCPLATNIPLTVVQPQEGAKMVADSVTRYEYEVFSGTAVSTSSEALNVDTNPLLAIGRALGIIKKPPVAAVHEFVLQAPDGTSRTFRAATDTAAVPVQKGERATVVSAPMRNVRKGGFFNASPPGTKPGQALQATNHKTGTVLQLLQPPVGNAQSGLPAWVLPTVVLLAGGDAASSLIDPSLPLLLAAGVATLTGSAVASSTVLVPRLKQLPEARLRVEAVRQQLLGQYSVLANKVAGVLQESAEDVRVLARLWQLQNKMEAVTAGVGASAAAAALPSSAAGGGYEARIERVARARGNVEERLVRKIELLDGYSRVMSMIEIEVELDTEVPAAEVAGIQVQLDRLVELESLQEDYRYQAEARDEVERLLRTA